MSATITSEQAAALQRAEALHPRPWIAHPGGEPWVARLIDANGKCAGKISSFPNGLSAFWIAEQVALAVNAAEMMEASHA